MEQQVTKLEDSLSVILLQAAKGFADMLSKAEDEWVQWWARSWTKQFARQYAARVQSVDGIQELLQGNGEANKLFTAALQWNKHEYAKV